VAAPPALIGASNFFELAVAGVTLAGIDSVMRPQEDRLEAWQRLADILDPAVFEDISADISLTEVVEVAGELIAGKIRGRIVVNISE
jgi:acrylyl-CoA reductase (NADPH)